MRIHHAIVSFFSLHFQSIFIQPKLPCRCKTSMENFLSARFGIIVDVDREALMVTHGSYDSCIGCLSYFLSKEDGEVQIVGLGLLPDVMRSIVPRPNYGIQIHFLDLPQEHIECLNGQIAFAYGAPMPRLLGAITLGSHIRPATHRLCAIHWIAGRIEQIRM